MEQQKPFQYDFIIAGAGLSGLMLAIELSNSSLKHKKVLLVDREEKNSNDRTWCFWGDHGKEINDITFKKWDNIRFASAHSDASYKTTPYQYKYIRGVDFYQYADQKLKENSNFQRILGTITTISPEGFVIVDGQRYDADLIFNSLHPSFDEFSYPKKECYYLLQHFKGYFIETEEDHFEEDYATFMDFDIEQHKEARFGYILPFSKREALVEYTLFSQNLLKKEEYIKELEDYISKKLGIKKYKIVHEEFGIVPMSTYSYQPKIDGKVIRIGTFGGFVKPSSGFAFSRTFKRIKKIVATLEQDGKINSSTLESSLKYKFYDNILLSILEKDNTTTKDIFEKMFTSVKTSTILKFLDEESSLFEDLHVMSLFIADKRFLFASMREIRKLLIGK